MNNELLYTLETDDSSSMSLLFLCQLFVVSLFILLLQFDLSRVKTITFATMD